MPDQEANSVYIDPRLELTTSELSLLNLNGFRRSGRAVYRPSCPNCNACTSIRIRLKDATHSKSNRRIINKNKKIRLHIDNLPESEKHYPVYEKYINQRHSDGGMYPPSFEQYRGFLLEHHGNCRFLSAYDDDQLVGALVFDLMDDGVSSVYCFFDPDYSDLSPATFLILTLSQIALGLKLPYHYLGYHVAGCQKMDYKTRYQPLEAFIHDKWQPYKA